MALLNTSGLTVAVAGPTVAAVVDDFFGLDGCHRLESDTEVDIRKVGFTVVSRYVGA